MGSLIPRIQPETEFEFSKLKEGRNAYSKVKTGIDYLPYKLASLDFAQAIEHIKGVHQLKHLAHAYMKENPSIADWPYDPYKLIVAYREKLRQIKNWDTQTFEQRHKKLLRVSL